MRSWYNFWISIGVVVVGVVGVGLLFTFEYGPRTVVQHGYRGLGLELVYNKVELDNKVAATTFPEPPFETEPAGVPASEVYENVQVLGHVDANEFINVMASITEWVSPEQGCAYCHAEGEELSADTLYTKRVARRMIQMTQTINSSWDAHVGATGATCYTCHRGQPVPENIWFVDPGPRQAGGSVASSGGQNIAAPAVGLSSLPYDPFSTFLSSNPAPIRVAGSTALPTGNDATIQQTERTYGLMFHMSESLGVNCNFCHNSRAFSDWAQSPPQRATAWHGIRMVQQLNATYLDPLQGEYPADRLGPLGDAPKANCTTCHQGAYKPLFGYQMLQYFPSLASSGPEQAAQPMSPAGGVPAPVPAPVPQ